MVQRKQPNTMMSRKPIRPIERQKMRPWLIEQLKSDPPVIGLAWLSKRDRTFRISWRHAARQGWNPRMDADLFERWARHTGKFCDGDEADPKRWKANFRCALNSLPDVKELKNLGLRRGQNAFKVYQFLDDRKWKSNMKIEESPKRTPRRRVRHYTKPIPTDDSDDDSDYASFEDDISCRDSTRTISESSFDGSSASDTDSVNEDRKLSVDNECCLPDFDKICDYNIESERKQLARDIKVEIDEDERMEESQAEETAEHIFQQIYQLSQESQEEELYVTCNEVLVDDNLCYIPVAMEEEVTTYNIGDEYQEYQVILETDAVRTEQMFTHDQTVYTAFHEL